MDADEPGWTDRQVAEAFRCRVRTVENAGRPCVLDGCAKVLAGWQEAQLFAVRLGPPPDYRNWSLQLLARRTAETVTRTEARGAHHGPEPAPFHSEVEYIGADHRSLSQVQ